MSRYRDHRDRQLQVVKNYSYLLNLGLIQTERYFTDRKEAITGLFVIEMRKIYFAHHDTDISFPLTQSGYLADKIENDYSVV